MAYKTKEKPQNIRSIWEELPPNYKTQMSIEEIQSIGGTKKYGNIGGKWINEMIYQSIGGYRSRGGIPLKLQTRTGDIPISATDAEELLRLRYISSMWD